MGVGRGEKGAEAGEGTEVRETETEAATGERGEVSKAVEGAKEASVRGRRDAAVEGGGR